MFNKFSGTKRTVGDNLGDRAQQILGGGCLARPPVLVEGHTNPTQLVENVSQHRHELGIALTRGEP